MIILLKKGFEDVVNVLIIVLVISLSVLFSILITQYSLLSITGLDIATTQGNVEEGMGIGLDISYKLVDFGNVYGGETKDTTAYTDVAQLQPKPIIVRNIGSEPIDVQISATPLWTSADAVPGDYKFSVSNPGITNAGLDTCSTACFTSTPAPRALPQIIPTQQPSPIPANAINNLNFQDANDEARIDIHVHVPVNQQGAVSSTVTLTGVYSNTF